MPQPLGTAPPQESQQPDIRTGPPRHGDRRPEPPPGPPLRPHTARRSAARPRARPEWAAAARRPGRRPTRAGGPAAQAPGTAHARVRKPRRGRHPGTARSARRSAPRTRRPWSRRDARATPPDATRRTAYPAADSRPRPRRRSRARRRANAPAAPRMFMTAPARPSAALQGPSQWSYAFPLPSSRIQTAEGAGTNRPVPDTIRNRPARTRGITPGTHMRAYRSTSFISMPTSVFDSRRSQPDFWSPRVIGPKAVRTSLSTGKPASASIRRTMCLRPSCRVTSTR